MAGKRGEEGMPSPPGQSAKKMIPSRVLTDYIPMIYAFGYEKQQF